MEKIIKNVKIWVSLASKRVAMATNDTSNAKYFQKLVLQ